MAEEKKPAPSAPSVPPASPAATQTPVTNEVTHEVPKESLRDEEEQGEDSVKRYAELFAHGVEKAEPVAMTSADAIPPFSEEEAQHRRSRAMKAASEYAKRAAPGEIPPKPRTLAPVTVEDIFAGIEAVDLTMPDFASDPLSANPNVMYRWVNFKVGDKESSLNYRQRVAQGFVNATLEDLKPESPTRAFWDPKLKAFINYDSILMKMDRKRYLGFLKKNYDNQLNLMSHAGDLARSRKHLRDELRGIGAPAELTRKVSTFIPGGKEAEELFREEPNVNRSR